MLMSKLIRKCMVIFILSCIIFSCFPNVGFAIDITNKEVDYKETDYFIPYAREILMNRGSWDKNSPFSQQNFSKTNEFTGVNALGDGSNKYPTEAYRALNDIKGGIVTIDFDFSMDNFMDSAFRLLDDKTTLFGIVTKGKGIYLEQPDGELFYLTNYSASYLTDALVYIVKAVIDFDNKKILTVQINGTTYAVDKPYANDIDKANGFDISTSEESVGVLTSRNLVINGGYIVYERFWNPNGFLPDDWKLNTGSGIITMYAANGRDIDKYSLLIDSSNDYVNYTKSISPVNGHLIFEINTLQPKKRDNFSINLKSNNENIFSLTSDGGNFCYIDANQNLVPFYKYMDNVWYNLKLDIDLDNSVAAIYLNNKLKKEKLPIDNRFNSIDGINIYSGVNKNNLVIDDILLYRKKPYGDDYVPEPQVAEKKDPNTLIAMQMCPLWTEGTHFGWDPIKAVSSDKHPLVGYYDEQNPEVADWHIKWMLENGVDFQYQCIYPLQTTNFDIPIQPIKNNLVREYHGIYEGFMNARYSDKMKFAALFESSTLTKGYSHYNQFFDYYLPFYIEYYFKDDRYMKIDGRPVFGIYAVDNFLKIFDDGSGMESIQKGIERIRKVCIDAGVGDPYLVANHILTSAVISRAAKAGLDAVSAYSSGNNASINGNNTTFTMQKTILSNAATYCKENGIDFWPIATPNRDDLAWRAIQGYSSTSEEFEQHLSWLKDNIVDKSSSRVSKKVINMTTWDEYGEGHIIAPTVGLGFSYLDAIRKSFTVNDAHLNIYPTEKQKKRMNTLYVADRKVLVAVYDGTTNKKLGYNKRENDTPKDIPSNVTKVFDFRKNEVAKLCAPLSQVGEIKITDEGIAVYPNGNNPTITLSGLINVDAFDVTYVKIRMKKNPTSGGGWLYWTSDLSPIYKEEQRTYFNPLIDNGSEFVDYYVPVARSIFWNGNIDGIKIMLGDISDLSTPFIVQSIEFLRDENITAKDKLIIDSWTQPLDPSVVIKDKTVMVPLQFVAFSAGATDIKPYFLTDTYTIKYNGTFSVITIGDSIAYVGGQEIPLTQGAFKVSDIVNDVVYVPIEFMDAVLQDKSITWNDANKTLSITSSDEEEIVNDQVDREVIWSVEFDSADDVPTTSQLTDLKFSDGKLTATTNGTDPILRFNANVLASNVKLIQIKMNTSAKQEAKIYFMTDKDATFNEAKSSVFKNTAVGDNIINFNPEKDITNWKDTITQFRWDVSRQSGQTFSIDSIIFYGDEIKKTGKIVDMSSSINKTTEKFEWTFSKNTNLDGWQANKSLGVEIKDGKLNAVIVGQMPILSNRLDIGIDASQISDIIIKYANNTIVNKARIYFKTDKMDTWTDECSFEFDVKSMDSKYTEYKIKTSTNEKWSGKINKLLFLPAENVKGSISIDQITLLLKKLEKEE